jgi:hypothetical protein
MRLPIPIGLLLREARQESLSATLAANLAVCSVLNPPSRIRAGSGSPSRQISHAHGLNGGAFARAAMT